jgi:hypothetical protein
VIVLVIGKIYILSGVPQGSVLGPLFFIIYINDLVSNLTTPCYIFADDTKIPSVNIHQYQSDSLQIDLDAINSWCFE